ncbi:MAG: ice-binding family protein, partial [Deltaproteobacteria bacterium]|nr:ice-binding family protein [Deltaproteobacteria bacterium]
MHAVKKMALVVLSLAVGIALHFYPSSYAVSPAVSVETVHLTNNLAAGPIPVALGTASAFAILTKSGITDAPLSTITGDIGSSPISGTAILISCPEVTGTIYSVDAAGPLPCRVTNATLLTAAVSDVEIAYNNAAGRTSPDFTELGAGEIGGLTLVPGLYKWSTNVLISTDVTLSGGANDVWIFQIAGNLTQANAKKMYLVGGARAKNIFW